MKRKTLRILIQVYLVLTLLIPLGMSLAQTEGEAADALRIENIQKPSKSVNVPLGGRIRVFLKDDRRYQGHLSAVGSSSMRVDSIDFNYEDIAAVKAPRVGSKGAKVTGMVMTIIGLVGVLLGGLMMLLGLNEANRTGNTGCETIFLVFILIMFAIIFGGIGLILLILGLVGLIVGNLAGRVFKMGPKWRLAKGMIKARVKNR